MPIRKIGRLGIGPVEDLGRDIYDQVSFSYGSAGKMNKQNLAAGLYRMNVPVIEPPLREAPKWICPQDRTWEERPMQVYRYTQRWQVVQEGTTPGTTIINPGSTDYMAAIGETRKVYEMQRKQLFERWTQAVGNHVAEFLRKTLAYNLDLVKSCIQITDKEGESNDAVYFWRAGNDMLCRYGGKRYFNIAFTQEAYAKKFETAALQYLADILADRAGYIYSDAPIIGRGILRTSRSPVALRVHPNTAYPEVVDFVGQETHEGFIDMHVLKPDIEPTVVALEEALPRLDTLDGRLMEELLRQRRLRAALHVEGDKDADVRSILDAA